MKLHHLCVNGNLFHKNIKLNLHMQMFFFFETYKNFQKKLFYQPNMVSAMKSIYIQTSSYSLVNGIGHYAFG